MLSEERNQVKTKKQWSIDFLQQKKSKLGHVEGVTYRMAGNLRRLENGQLVSNVNKMRDVHGKQRKELRRLKREENQLLEIEKGME